jgi:hypothetical protein
MEEIRIDVRNCFLFAFKVEYRQLYIRTTITETNQSAVVIKLSEFSQKGKSNGS